MKLSQIVKSSLIATAVMFGTIGSAQAAPGDEECQINKIDYRPVFYRGSPVLVAFIHGDRKYGSDSYLRNRTPYRLCGHDVNREDVIMYDVGSDHFHAMIALDPEESDFDIGTACRVEANFKWKRGFSKGKASCQMITHAVDPSLYRDALAAPTATLEEIMAAEEGTLVPSE